jgi:UDP-glucose 4-epimerase
MRVLVTGGAGYIGSVTTEVLCDRGDTVVVYDDLSTGHRAAIDPRAAFVEGNLLDTERLRGALEAWNIDAVMHMAAKALVGESVTDPAKYYQNNVMGGVSLLEAMRRSGVARIVFSSTCAIFGQPTKMPIEEDDPKRPLNPYGWTKLAFEGALDAYEAACGIRSICLRYFNAAGATERFGEAHVPETHLIPNLIRVALGQLPSAQIHGDDYPTRDGTCVRDYVHIRDLADAHARALDRVGEGSGRYNLGCGGDGYTVQEVVDAVRRVTGHPVPIVMGPRRPGDPATLVATSVKAQAALGWVPKQESIDAIVQSAWDWHTKHRDGYGD